MYFNLSLLVMYALEALAITLAIYVISQKSNLYVKEIFGIFLMLFIGIYIVNQITFEKFTVNNINNNNALTQPPATFETILPPTIDNNSHVVPLNNKTAESFGTDNVNGFDEHDDNFGRV